MQSIDRPMPSVRPARVGLQTVYTHNPRSAGLQRPENPRWVSESDLPGIMLSVFRSPVPVSGIWSLQQMLG
jgi:hypothetical protein